MTKRPALAAYMRTKAEKASGRRKPAPLPVHDRRAVDLPKGVIAAVVEVRDPYDDAGGKITVTQNIRGDTLGYMKARNQISEHQYQAGRHWQGLYERAGIGQLKAADPTKEPVDGGGAMSDGITDGVVNAVKGLARADAALGLHGMFLIREVLGTGVTLDVYAESRGMASKTGKDRVGYMFRQGLNALAVAFGYADHKLLKPELEQTASH